MGLDNFPKNYPCKAQGTAVMETASALPHTERINCNATQEAGGCPWLNANPPGEGRVYGILGTDCWYRGQYGNAILHDAGMGGGVDFYGDSDDSTEKSPESCIELADAIAQFITHTFLPDVALTEETASLKADLEYAEWYLRWAAEQADGLVCWY